MTTSYESRLGTAPEEGIKAPCVASTTANITLSGAQTIDGVAVVAGDRVLVRSQTDTTENGIYDASTSAWTRSTDFNDPTDLINGNLVPDANSVNDILYQVQFSGDYEPGVTLVTFRETVSSGLITYTGADGIQAEYNERGQYQVNYMDDLIDVDLTSFVVGETVNVNQINVSSSGIRSIWKKLSDGATPPDAAAGINSDDFWYSASSSATKFERVPYKELDSIANLRLTGGLAGQSIFLTGYNAVGDGDGGDFYWDNTSTDADDGGTIIKVTAITTGRWKRRYSGALNVKWFGAIGDGATDDTAATSATNAATTNEVYIPSGSYNITSNLSFTNRVRFDENAVLNIATGVTVTIGNGISAPASKIFNTTGTGEVSITKLLAPHVYAEWWGALCNGSNDDALACQAANNALAGNGGIIQLLSRGYTFKTSLTITTHSITLRGSTSGSAPIDYGAGGNDGSRIIGTNGVNCIILNEVGYAKVHDINIYLPVGATSSTVGIRVISCFLPKIYDCRITNFSNGIHLTNTTDSYIDRCYISSTDVTVSPVIGIEVDGGSNKQNPTVNISHCISAHGAYSGIAYGYWLHGERINDTFFDLCEADFCTQGFFIDGTSGDTNYGADIHLRGCVSDGNVQNGFLIQNLNVDSMIEIINGWSAGGTINIYSTTSSKVTVSGMQVLGGQHGIYIRDSSQATVTDNILSYQTGSHIVIDNNPASIISNNQFYQKAATPASVGVDLLTGSDHCTIMGNVGYGTVAGSIGSGIVTATGCDYCNIIGNIMDSNFVTTPYTLNLGSNTNSVQLGTTA